MIVVSRPVAEYYILVFEALNIQFSGLRDFPLGVREFEISNSTMDFEANIPLAHHIFQGEFSPRHPSVKPVLGHCHGEGRSEAYRGRG